MSHAYLNQRGTLDAVRCNSEGEKEYLVRLENGRSVWVQLEGKGSTSGTCDYLNQTVIFEAERYARSVPSLSEDEFQYLIALGNGVRAWAQLKYDPGLFDD